MTCLIKYFERYWLSTVGVKGLSVFNQSHRTNNVCESANRRWNSMLTNERHPLLQEFLRILQYYEAVAAIDSFTISQDSRASVSESKFRKIAPDPNKIIDRELKIQQEWMRFPPTCYL